MLEVQTTVEIRRCVRCKNLTLQVMPFDRFVLGLCPMCGALGDLCVEDTEFTQAICALYYLNGMEAAMQEIHKERDSRRRRLINMIELA